MHASCLSLISYLPEAACAEANTELRHSVLFDKKYGAFRVTAIKTLKYQGTTVVSSNGVTCTVATNGLQIFFSQQSIPTISFAYPRNHADNTLSDLQDVDVKEIKIDDTAYRARVYRKSTKSELGDSLTIKWSDGDITFRSPTIELVRSGETLWQPPADLMRKILGARKLLVTYDHEGEIATYKVAAGRALHLTKICLSLTQAQ